MTRPAARTEGEPVIVAEITAGLPDWLLVPTRSADDGFDEPGWRGVTVELFDELARADLEIDVAPPALDVDATLTDLLDMADSLDDSSRLVAGLGLPGRWPLPVIVSAADTEDDVDLLELGLARGGHPAEAPTVEDLPDGDGPGIVVSRADVTDDREVWATVTCVRRRDGLDVVALWRTNDLGLVVPFREQVVRLMPLIRVGPWTDGSDA